MRLVLARKKGGTAWLFACWPGDGGRRGNLRRWGTWRRHCARVRAWTAALERCGPGHQGRLVSLEGRPKGLDLDQYQLRRDASLEGYVGDSSVWQTIAGDGLVVSGAWLTWIQ